MRNSLASPVGVKRDSNPVQLIFHTSCKIFEGSLSKAEVTKCQVSALWCENNSRVKLPRDNSNVEGGKFGVVVQVRVYTDISSHTVGTQWYVRGLRSELVGKRGNSYF